MQRRMVRRAGETGRRWLSVLAAGALTAGLALVATTATTVVAPSAAAAPPLACDTLYALQGSNPHAIYQVDTDTGDLTALHEMDVPGGDTNNALGISADGQFAFTHAGDSVFVFDTDSETTEEFDAGPDFNATHGAVDPATGVYYFGNIDGSENFAHVHAFDPVTETYLGEVAQLQMPGGGPGGNGDWAFDASGNLYFTSGESGSNVDNAFYVARGPLPTTNDPGPPAEIVARQISDAQTADPINGLAVDVLGFVYLSSSDNLFQVNPTSGVGVNQESLDPTDESVDLASCATPSTVMVQKDVVDRRNPTDQFTVSMTGGDIPPDATGNTGTTTGQDTGVQDETGEFGGPLMVIADQTITITETAAGTTDLGEYTTSWECVNQTDGELVAEGTGTEGEFTVPVADQGELGAAVLCTFTNEDLPQSGLDITKTADPSDEVAPGDTVDYEITVENTGETTYTTDDPATFTDDLSGVLDDATYNEDAAADLGEATFADQALSWSSGDDDFAPGDTATITYSVTVNDPLSGDGTLDNAVVGPPESNCVDGTEDDCHVPIPIRALEIEKSVEPTGEVTPGDTVSYTVEVTNTGQVPYTAANPASFTDDLSEVTDDATYNDDAAADVGEASYDEPELTWSGPLPPGETATITYSVTVNDPPSGDGTLDNAVVGPPESNCLDGTEDGCHIVVPDRSLEIEKSADPSGEVLPGDTVDYTITVTNTGQVPYGPLNPATFTDDLSGVIDDATYNEDAAADVGEVGYSDPELSWSGELAPGDTATITYSVTVNDPDEGDGTLDNAVVGPDESNCDDGTEDDCHVPIPVRSLEIEKSAEPSGEVLPGDTVDYTITVTNTGQVPYTAANPATFTDDLTEVTDDATYNDDAAADVGEVGYSDPELSWSGPLPPGQTATITYSVTVDDPDTGDGTLDNAVVGPPESNCDDGTEDDCHVPIPVRSLEIEKSAEPTGEVSPGDTVSYTVEVTNTGQVPYTAANPATFTDDLTDVIDDATYNEDAAADVGEASYDEPELTWSGPLPPGETATITYSVTVNDPDEGDHQLDNAVVGPDESNCDDGTEDGCHVPIPVRSLQIVKTSRPIAVQPGGTVTYTVEVTNTGRVPYTTANPATFTDDLTDVIDDATYNDDAAADIGTTSYTEPNLSWSGALAPGETATITYSVTVPDPPTGQGDGELTNAVVGPEESNCDDGTEDECHTDVPIRELLIEKTADVDEALPGDVVTYTIEVTNVGEFPFGDRFPARFDDDLTGVLDDATYNNDASADIGDVTYSDPTLHWESSLQPGETATITYSVTVNDPDEGDGELGNVVTGPPVSNCDPDGPGFPADECDAVVPVKSLEISKTAQPAGKVDPGDTVSYTVTVENTGQVPYSGGDPATFTDDMTDVLDDATFNDDAAADIGQVDFDDPELSWSGPLAPGETATVTYSVTVDDPPDGDGTLRNAVVGPDESNCDEPAVAGLIAAAAVARCHSIVPTNDPDGSDDPPDESDEPPGPDLPDTGSEVDPMVILIGLLLLAGGSTLLVAWRRRS